MVSIYNHMHKSSPTIARRGLFYTSTIVTIQLPQFIFMIVGIFVDIKTYRCLAVSTITLSAYLNMMVFVYRRKMKTGS